MEKFKFLAKNKTASLPETAGVYAFFKGKKFLYIGKAVNLKERIKQHQEPFSFSAKIGYIKTDSAIEALLLEAKLIKKHQPKYNVAWRDDKNYFFIVITKENFPRVFITHQPKNERGRTSFIGPFVDGRALKETLKVLRRVFPYRSCKNLPKSACLWYQLDRCPAPCLLKSEIKNQKLEIICQRNAKNLIKILRGEKKQTLNTLQKEMKNLATQEKFEEAAKIKNQINALEKVFLHTKILKQPQLSEEDKSSFSLPFAAARMIEAYDVSNIQGKEATGAMITFIDGKPEKSFYRRFKIKIQGKPNDVAMLKEILERRLKHTEWPYPDSMLIDGGKAQLNTAVSLTEIPIMALAKKKNELYIKGQKNPTLLKNMPREIFNLILQLRDEAHRFARVYHHLLRDKTLLD